jgi:hypothetical protein
VAAFGGHGSNVMGDDWNYACTASTCSSQRAARTLYRGEPTSGLKSAFAFCTPAVLENEITASTSYSAAHNNFQYGCHVDSHVIFSGSSDMATHESPFDPLFWSHHAMLDHAWHVWQECASVPGSTTRASFDSYFNGMSGINLDDVMPGFGSDKIISQVERAHTIADAWDTSAYALYEADGVDQLVSGTCGASATRRSTLDITDLVDDFVISACQNVQANWEQNIANNWQAKGAELSALYGIHVDVFDSAEKVKVIEILFELQNDGTLTDEERLQAARCLECAMPNPSHVGPEGQAMFFMPDDVVIEPMCPPLDECGIIATAS